MTYDLSQHPKVFQSLTGLRLSEFDDLIKEVLPMYAEAEYAR